MRAAIVLTTVYGQQHHKACVTTETCSVAEMTVCRLPSTFTDVALVGCRCHGTPRKYRLSIVLPEHPLCADYHTRCRALALLQDGAPKKNGVPVTRKAHAGTKSERSARSAWMMVIRRARGVNNRLAPGFSAMKDRDLPQPVLSGGVIYVGMGLAVDSSSADTIEVKRGVPSGGGHRLVRRNL